MSKSGDSSYRTIPVRPDTKRELDRIRKALGRSVGMPNVKWDFVQRRLIVAWKDSEKRKRP